MTSSSSFYPQIEEVDLSNKVATVIESANVVRINYINDYIYQLEKDYKRYGNKKHRYARAKNILGAIDIVCGTSLFITAVVLEAASLGNNPIISLSLGGAGMLLVATLPLTNKVTDLAANKNRNFEILAVKKLNMCKEIFSKSIDDGEITHDEFLQVLECKRQYEEAKKVLKQNNKKEIEELFDQAKIPKESTNVTLEELKKS